jgi:transcription elongation factor Elf1
MKICKTCGQTIKTEKRTNQQNRAMKICKTCGQTIKTEKRTNQQNRALHKYFSLLSDSLNDAGFSVRKTLRNDIEIDWTQQLVKELLWRPVQLIITQKDSTTDLNKIEEITKIYDTLNRFLGEKTGVYVPFPSEKEMIRSDE